MNNEQMLVTITVGQLRLLIREELSKEIEKANKPTPPQHEESEVMTIDSLASYLKCSRQTIHNHIKAGKLPKPFRVGRRALWDKATLEVFLKSVS